MCGVSNRGEQRKQLLQERDDRIAVFMEQGRAVAVIAELEGLEPDYCRKATRRIAEERSIEYSPEKEPVPRGLLSDASRRFRNNVANEVYKLRETPGRHPLEISRDTGLTQFQIGIAIDKGGLHDYKLSQLERIAAASNDNFTNMMLKALLTPEQFDKVARCLNS